MMCIITPIVLQQFCKQNNKPSAKTEHAKEEADLLCERRLLLRFYTHKNTYIIKPFVLNDE